MSTTEKLRANRAMLAQDLIPCAICGKLFRMVCRHVVAAHRMTTKEYKQLVGMPLSVGIVGPEFRSIVLENKEMMDEKCARMRAVDRSKIRQIGPKNDYVAPGCAPLADRAREHRKKMHDDARARWEGVRDQFSRLWLSGTPVAEISAALGVAPSQVRLLRNVLGLPSRSFRHWTTQQVVEEAELTSRGAIEVRRQATEGRAGTPGHGRRA